MAIREAAARRRRARERTRRDILVAAASVFARRGYAAATLSDLAEAAGYAPPSLYRYFESKEEIFRSLVELLLEELDATFREPVDRRQPLAARLEALVRSQVRLALSRREAFQLLSSPVPGAPAVVAGRPVGDPGAGIAYYEEQFRDWLARNASPRELRHAPERVARAFAGIVFAFHRRGDLDGADPFEGARLVVDLALHGIARDDAAPPRPGRKGAAA